MIEILQPNKITGNRWAAANVLLLLPLLGNLTHLKPSVKDVKASCTALQPGQAKTAQAT